jgi:hypothetical protein
LSFENETCALQRSNDFFRSRPRQAREHTRRWSMLSQ